MTRISECRENMGWLFEKPLVHCHKGLGPTGNVGIKDWPQNRQKNCSLASYGQRALKPGEKVWPNPAYIIVCHGFPRVAIDVGSSTTSRLGSIPIVACIWWDPNDLEPCYIMGVPLPSQIYSMEHTGIGGGGGGGRGQPEINMVRFRGSIGTSPFTL